MKYLGAKTKGQISGKEIVIKLQEPTMKKSRTKFLLCRECKMLVLTTHGADENQQHSIMKPAQAKSYKDCAVDAYKQVCVSGTR
jgi:hypothetical protein